MSPRHHCVSLAKSQHYVINPTNPGCALNDGVEDRLYVRGRPTDDAEHLSGCRLVLQRLAQFCVAPLKFFEEAHVFNRDHGLIRESFEKSDLFLDERINFPSANENRSNRGTFAHQRDSKLGSITFTELDDLRDLRELSRSYRQQILNMDRLTFENGSAR